jgi:hypothetical protein
VTTVAFVVNAGRRTSEQHQKLIEYSVRNARNDGMKPTLCMGLFCNACGRDSKEKEMRKWNGNNE